MKDHRFIELLNLYIDRQITAEETAELEAEIQRDPRRQAVYRQYCQIHAATKLVYESFRTGASEEAAPSGRPATIELFETRRRSRWAQYAGGIAVAAAAAVCVGLLVARHNADAPQVAAPVVAKVAPAPVQPAVRLAPASATAAAPVVASAQPRLVSLRTPASSPDYSAMLAALREQDEERALATDRWARSQQSLFDDSLFDAKRPLPESELRPATARPNAGQQAEFTAFQFQR